MKFPIRWNMKDTMCDAYYTTGAASSSMHGHYHFLMTLITKGTGIQTVNGVDITFCPGDMFILSPADFHKNTSNAEDYYEYYGVKFPYEILGSRLSELCEWDRFPVHVHLSESAAQKAGAIFAMLTEESQFGNRRLASHVYLQSMVEQLFILAMRELPLAEKKCCNMFSNRVLGYLYAHFREDITVTDAATYIGYTTNYFSTLFREIFGIPFGLYLRKMRLTYAKNLILSSDMSLTDISMEAGFSSLSHFSKSFKIEYGVSPQEYRKHSEGFNN